MLAQPVSRRSFLVGAAAVLLAPKKQRPRPPATPPTAVQTFRLRASSLRGGAYLRGGL